MIAIIVYQISIATFSKLLINTKFDILLQNFENRYFAVALALVWSTAISEIKVDEFHVFGHVGEISFGGKGLG